MHNVNVLILMVRFVLSFRLLYAFLQTRELNVKLVLVRRKKTIIFGNWFTTHWKCACISEHKRGNMVVLDTWFMILIQGHIWILRR